MTPTDLQSSISNAQNLGKTLQNQYNAQVPGLQQNYGQAQNQANQGFQNLTNYANNLPQSYTNDMNQIGGMMGYNPGTTQRAATGLTSAENIMGALPQAVNQMGNYSGATTGQIAQNYSNMAGNIGQQVTNANNALQNQLGMFGQMQTGAQNITSQQGSAYAAAYQNAVSQMQNAGTVMSNIENLQQQQGYITAEQVAQYNSAYQAYQQGQMTAQQATQQQYQNTLTQKYMNSQALKNYLGTGSTSKTPTTSTPKKTTTPAKKTSSPTIGSIIGNVGKDLTSNPSKVLNTGIYAK